MHPNPEYHTHDRALSENLIAAVGFGMVFAATPDGPRAAHTPLLCDGEGHVQFHLARGNALTRHLAGTTALIVVNGPDHYISPRWYDQRDTVPTWDYVALELEGRIERLSDEALEAFLHAAITKHETRLAGEPWRAEESSEKTWGGLVRGIAGFGMQVTARRLTVKLSQKKPQAERERIAVGLEAAGAPALAHLIRNPPA